MADENKDPDPPPLPPLPPLSGKVPPPPLPPAGGAPGLPPLPPILGGALTPPLPPGAGKTPPPVGPSKAPPGPAMGGAPPLPVLPGIPPLPPRSAAAPPAPPAFGSAPVPPTLGGAPVPPAPPRPPERTPDAPSVKAEYDKKVAELEKRLQDEREKLLMANLKTSEEAATAARVEVSIKELQDKLRRDRRDQEQEEARLKLESKLQETEARLAQERETWVSTLKGQMQTREAQDKELESHFATRVQEMERRWLEEKAHWQKTVLAKDDEIRNLRNLAEKLKGVDSELARTAAEKKALESRLSEMLQQRSEAEKALQNRLGDLLSQKAEVERSLQGRIAELAQDRAEMQGKVAAAADKDKEAIALRAETALVKQELFMAQQQLAGAQDKYERELQALRASTREREERLLSELDRAQRDLMSLTAKSSAQTEAEAARLKAIHEAETNSIKSIHAKELQSAQLSYDERLRKHDEASARSAEETARLRAVSGALERQLAAQKLQVDGLQKAAGEWHKTQERYKAEFMVLQRKWLEREKEIRAEFEEQARQWLEGEKSKLRQQFGEEHARKAAVFSDQLKAEKEKLEAEHQAELARARAAENEALAAQKSRLEAAAKEWRDRVSELGEALTRESEAKRLISEGRLEIEKLVQSRQEEIGRLKAAAAEAGRLRAQAEAERAETARQKEGIERLAMAQAAEIKNISEGLAHMRTQMLRAAEETKLAVQEKGSLERRLELQKKEAEIVTRDLRRRIGELEGRLGGGPAPDGPREGAA